MAEIVAQRRINKVQTVLDVINTVASPVSLEEEAETRPVLEARIFDVEENFIRRSELGSLRTLLRKAFRTLTPDEVEAVQESFSLDILSVPDSTKSPDRLRNVALLPSAMRKLRQVPEIQALHRQNPLDSKTIPVEPVKIEVMTAETEREIPPIIIAKVHSLKEQRQGNHGGLNNSQICMKLGITKAELTRILSLPKMV